MSRMLRSVRKEIILDFEQSVVRQSFDAGGQPFGVASSIQSGSLIFTPSKRTHYNVSQGILSSEESPSKRNLLSTPIARNPRLQNFSSGTGECRSSGDVGGFHTELKLRRADGTEVEWWVIMLAYYAYKLHPRVDSASKIQEPEDVDWVILVELLNLYIDPRGYKVILEMMIHRPCGAFNMSATCIQGDKCTKSFP
nr:DNA helicase [Tanacetum cinerariifolium]GEZ76211.1 DNA helicase [Tanacetum cinerariifolium]